MHARPESVIRSTRTSNFMLDDDLRVRSRTENVASGGGLTRVTRDIIGDRGEQICQHNEATH